MTFHISFLTYAIKAKFLLCSIPMVSFQRCQLSFTDCHRFHWRRMMTVTKRNISFSCILDNIVDPKTIPSFINFLRRCLLKDDLFLILLEVLWIFSDSFAWQFRKPHISLLVGKAWDRPLFSFLVPLRIKNYIVKLLRTHEDR